MKHAGALSLLLALMIAACGRQGALVPPDGSPEDPRLTRYQEEMKREDAARQGGGLIDTDPLPDPDEDRHRSRNAEPPQSSRPDMR